MADPTPIRDWHQIAVELLMTDADLALLSISLIFRHDDPEMIRRLVRNARETYDTIQAKRKELALSERDAAALDHKMERLRIRLRVLGNPV